MRVYTVYVIYEQRGIQMQLYISNSSEKPIYEQICAQIKTAILNNELKEGEALPSIRYLAKELRISVITTKRAYEELEKSGFITTQAGRGSFVSLKNKEIVREELYRQIEDMMQKAVAVAQTANISKDELIEILEICYEEVS